MQTSFPHKGKEEQLKSNTARNNAAKRAHTIKDTRPLGRARFVVRGFFASIFLSMHRFMNMPAERAAKIARRTRNNVQSLKKGRSRGEESMPEKNQK